MRIEQRVGKRLREAREQKGLTQEQLGDAVAYYLGHPWSKQTVSIAESGGRDFIARELLAIAMLLGKPLYWFFGLGDGLGSEGPFEAIADAEKVQMPTGRYVSEQAILEATGRRLDDAERLAGQLEHLAREVRSLRPGEGMPGEMRVITDPEEDVVPEPAGGNSITVSQEEGSS